jgi:hypothetical protein
MSTGLAEVYRTRRGFMALGTIEEALESRAFDRLLGNVDLILTSPPFPLKSKKKYGNLNGDAYVDWLAGLAPILARLLAPTGSLVMEVGNAWEPGRPAMSTLPLKALMAFTEAGEFQVCQQFICQNTARLPTPAQWVAVERIRAKDSYTHVWWLARTDRPKANNRNVLVEYSTSMKALLRNGSYNFGKRPSGHSIREDSFLKDNGGAIPSNVLSIANTRSQDAYRDFCNDAGLEAHPAIMPKELAEFFIKFLTEDGDLVLDPFAGSNMTGASAERLGRRWVAVEPNASYAEGSVGRFERSALVRVRA